MLSALFDGYEQRSIALVATIGALLVPGAFLWFAGVGIVLYLLCLIYVGISTNPGFLFRNHPLFDNTVNSRSVLLSWLAIFSYINAAIFFLQLSGPPALAAASATVFLGVVISLVISYFEQI